MNARVRKRYNNYFIEMKWGEAGERKTKTLSVRKQLGLDRPAKWKEASALRDKIMQDSRQGVYIEPSDEPLGSYLSRWLDGYKYSLKDTTHESYEYLLEKHIIPDLGSLPLSKIRPSTLRGFYQKKIKNGRRDGKGGLSPRTVIYMHTIIRLALKHAVEDEILPKNVADSVSPPKQRKPKIEYWEWEEAKQFVEATRKDRYHMVWYIALNTGMARGEILGLRWTDIDFQNKTITINQTVVNKGNSYKIQPSAKTENRERTLDVSKELINKLKEHKKVQNEERLSKGYESKHNLIFTTQAGQPVIPRHLSRYLERKITYLNKIGYGLPHIGSHGLRHTYATRLLEEGVHPKVVSERLGHASIKITLDTYSHVIPRLQKEVAELTSDL